jgi:hypothetical protein
LVAEVLSLRISTDERQATLPRSEVDTDGITGLRVNHLLDVHIGDLMLGM